MTPKNSEITPGFSPQPATSELEAYASPSPSVDPDTHSPDPDLESATIQPGDGPSGSSSAGDSSFQGGIVSFKK
jgi:hypothetical protein